MPETTPVLEDLRELLTKITNNESVNLQEMVNVLTHAAIKLDVNRDEIITSEEYAAAQGATEKQKQALEKLVGKQIPLWMINDQIALLVTTLGDYDHNRDGITKLSDVEVPNLEAEAILNIYMSQISQTLDAYAPFTSDRAKEVMDMMRFKVGFIDKGGNGNGKMSIQELKEALPALEARSGKTREESPEAEAQGEQEKTSRSPLDLLRSFGKVNQPSAP